MAPRIYEIKVYKAEREIRGVNPFCAGLDLDSAESTAALLNGHLYGAVLRSGGRRDEAHLFHMEVRGVDSYGKGAGQVLFRWALPAPEVTDGGT